MNEVIESLCQYHAKHALVGPGGWRRCRWAAAAEDMKFVVVVVACADGKWRTTQIPRDRNVTTTVLCKTMGKCGFDILWLMELCDRTRASTVEIETGRCDECDDDDGDRLQRPRAVTDLPSRLCRVRVRAVVDRVI